LNQVDHSFRFTSSSSSALRLQVQMNGVPFPWVSWYGVVTIHRLLQIISLFCKWALQKRQYSAKETYNFKEPTNRSHPIALYLAIAIYLLVHPPSFLGGSRNAPSYRDARSYTSQSDAHKVRLPLVLEIADWKGGAAVLLNKSFRVSWVI